MMLNRICSVSIFISQTAAFSFFFLNNPPPPEIYTLPLPAPLPISPPHAAAPVLDPNVPRLLRRHFGVAVSARARTRQLWDLSAAVIPKGQGYLINQALMDLGALVCKARVPRCSVCPLWRSCAFFRRQNQARSQQT